MVDHDDTSIFVTAQLLEVTQTIGYFHTKRGLTLKEDTGVVNNMADNIELCARSCFQNKNCGAFSYCSALNCHLWTDDDFNKEFQPELGPENSYNWEKIPKVKQDDCTYGWRIVKYNENNHLSNKEYLAKLAAKIENKEIDKLIVVDDKFKDVEFQPDGLQINVLPGRHTAGSGAEDEKLGDPRNQAKYQDLFRVIHSSSAFNKEKVDAKKNENGEGRLIAQLTGLALWECQLLCVNNENCKSMSYCRGSDECLLTTIENANEIGESTLENHKCAVSISKYRES